MLQSCLEIKNIAKDHAGEKALRDLTLSIPNPCLFGIIGADGAGKSTLMNILSTLTNWDTGEGKILGLDIRNEYQKIRQDIGYMPQRFSLYQDLSVIENLDFFSEIFGITGKEKQARTDYLLNFADLTSFTNRRAGLLSGGMKQKLALACTLIHHPKLLLLDEPTVGVDPVARRDFWRMLKSLRAENISIVVSTPYMDEAALCDELILLHQGATLAHGSPAELLSQYPYELYRIDPKPQSTTNAESVSYGPYSGTLTYPGEKNPPPGFALVYPSSGALHAAQLKSQDKTDSKNTDENSKKFKEQNALERILIEVPRAGSATLIDASLEDFFFALLLGHSPTKPNEANLIT